MPTKTVKIKETLRNLIKRKRRKIYLFCFMSFLLLVLAFFIPDKAGRILLSISAISFGAFCYFVGVKNNLHSPDEVAFEFRLWAVFNYDLCSSENVFENFWALYNRLESNVIVYDFKNDKLTKFSNSYIYKNFIVAQQDRKKIIFAKNGRSLLENVL
jgi:hypothetical protein